MDKAAGRWGGEAAVLSRLIGMIYDCAIDPLGWEATLEELRGALNFCNGMFTVWTAPSGKPLLNVTSGIAPQYAARIAEFGGAIVQQWGGAAAINAFEVGEPQVLSRQRVAADAGDGAYQREWLEPQGIADLMAVAVTRDSGLYCSMGFARHRADGAIGEAEIELVRLLAPHVRRAVAISRLLDISAVTASTFAATLDALPTPALVLDEELGIVHANRAGHRLLMARDGIGEERGRLSLPSPGLAQALRRAFGEGRQDEALAGIPLAREAGPALLHVLPLRHGDLRPNLMPRAAGVVFVAAGDGAPLPGTALAALFGLTPAETRVLAAIATGATLSETATRLGVGIGTARTHLLRLFAKTGTSRQAELVRLTAALSL